MKKLRVDIPDTVFKKLEKRKREDKFGRKPWADWLRHITKNVTLVEGFDEAITKGTRDALAKLWMENFVMNLKFIVDLDTYPDGKDANSLGLLPKSEGEPALIIAAGPSIREHDHVKMLAEKGFKGKIFACDRMLVPLLEAGVIPDYVACVDGNRELIVKFYENPLVDQHASKITGLFASTAAPNAAKRFLDAGGKINWYHGMLDNFWELDSVTSFMNHMTGSTAISCGGNVGASCWTLSVYLRCNPVIFTGFDLGYTKEVPFEETAYYKVLSDAGVDLKQMRLLFSSGVNPDFGNVYYQDIVFRHYREAILSMIATAKADPLSKHVETINATEGGAVHSSLIKAMKFSKVLEKYGSDAR